MAITRNNHYVPQWYQKGFLNGKDKLFYLDLNPDKIKNSTTGEIVHEDGNPKIYPALKYQPISKCFFQKDLYSIFFGSDISGEIERMLFGKIDSDGAKAVKAFIGEDILEWDKHLANFFSYIDTQKIRTPKGLDWIKKNYSELGQNDLMTEMQKMQGSHLTIWTEGVREIVAAKNSDVKFILSDHPVTIYNYASPPNSSKCDYPDDPPIAWKATQTIFPLDMNHCLILTNLEYAQNPSIFPKKNRTNARNFGHSIMRGDALTRLRMLKSGDVEKINFIIKSRAGRYIAASNKEWLYPDIRSEWSDLKEVLLPPSDELFKYSGEIYFFDDDGGIHYQDAFGRTTPENPRLKKGKRKKEPESNDLCGCGSGIEYKKCCKGKKENERPSWSELSIRERNIILYDGINDILGLDKGKSWYEVRQSLSSEQVKNIQELYESLWPLHTDLISLLPKQDKKIRAIYSGDIDPKYIIKFAVGLTPYFDEIIIQNTFINPPSRDPEMNPVKSPDIHKLMTLKNVYLLRMLSPFIDRGYINFIPDISDFNFFLYRQKVDLARKRSKDIQIDEATRERNENDIFHYTMLSMPKDQIRNQIKLLLPNLSEEEVEKRLDYMENKKRKDPILLLQNDANSNESESHILGMSTQPNFEIFLFLSQITGAVLLTDNPYRWKEIDNAWSGKNAPDAHKWSKLINHINQLQYVVSDNLMETFRLRASGKLDSFRETMREAYSTIQENDQPSDELVEKVKKQVIQAHYVASKEVRKNLKCSSTSKLNYLIPKGGIAHNNVQRLLLSSGQENYLSSAPIAIFAEPYPQ